MSVHPVGGWRRPRRSPHKAAMANAAGRRKAIVTSAGKACPRAAIAPAPRPRLSSGRRQGPWPRLAMLRRWSSESVSSLISEGLVSPEEDDQPGPAAAGDDGVELASGAPSRHERRRTILRSAPAPWRTRAPSSSRSRSREGRQLPAWRRASDHFVRRSFNASPSSPGSAGSRFSSALSRPSAFRRLASETSIPPSVAFEA